MVDIARYFLSFTQEESCGKCTFCRVGTKRMLDILDNITKGKGKPGDIEELEKLAEWTKKGSLCGLGKTAPNPVLSTLKYFRDEYEAHINGVITSYSIHYTKLYELFTLFFGRTFCAGACPLGAIQDLVVVKPIVITSYSIHYTKLYDSIIITTELFCTTGICTDRTGSIIKKAAGCV